VPTVRILTAALLLGALLPASASAQDATIAKPALESIYTGVDGVDDISVTLNNPPAIIFQRSSGAMLSAGANCTDVFAGSPQERTRIACPPGGVTVNLNGGADKVIGGSDGHGMTFDGGAGDDQLYVSSAAQNTLRGGDGADILRASGINRDTQDGGPGDDRIEYPRGADELRGGSGIDTLVVVPNAGVTITLDGAADDGAAGVKFNAHPDIENVVGSDEADALVGSPAANRLEGRGGDDEIDARDGVRDAVDCGTGDDTATIDLADLPVSGCETVRLPDAPAPAPGPGPAPVPGPGPGAVPGPVVVGPKLQPATVRNRWLLVRKGAKVDALAVANAPQGARVRVTCSGGGCAFARATLTVGRRGGAALTRRFKGRRLRPGAVIEVRVTAAGHFGKVVRYTVRAGKLPAAEVLCLAPGARKPTARC